MCSDEVGGVSERHHASGAAALRDRQSYGIAAQPQAIDQLRAPARHRVAGARRSGETADPLPWIAPECEQCRPRGQFGSISLVDAVAFLNVAQPCKLLWREHNR